MDAALLDHLGYEVLSLFLVNAQEVAKFVKTNVHVDFANHDDVMLDKGLFQHCVAISHGDVLVVLQLLQEILDMTLADDLAYEHFLKQLVKLARLRPLIIVQDGQQSSLLRAARG